MYAIHGPKVVKFTFVHLSSIARDVASFAKRIIFSNVNRQESGLSAMWAVGDR